MELPAAVSQSAVAVLKVEGPQSIRLVQGMQTQLPWKFESAVPGLRPPQRVIANSVGSREVNVRVGEVGAEYISQGWVRIGTTVGTPVFKFNLVLSGPVEVGGAPVTLYSRPLTVEVVPGYRLSLAGEGIGLSPGGGGELLGRVEREPAFKQPVSIRPENFPLGVSCPPVEVPRRYRRISSGVPGGKIPPLRVSMSSRSLPPPCWRGEKRKRSPTALLPCAPGSWFQPGRTLPG